MQWMVVYHEGLREDWSSTRRTLGSVLVWFALALVVYCTRYPVVFIWDPLPWIIVAAVLTYYVALTLSLIHISEPTRPY